MNLKFLNKIELDERMKTLAQRERDLLHDVLLTIKEIDSRKTYLELGFGSLFDYLVKGVGYSEGSAQRRIDAARLIREIPAVADKIQSGELKLNQISLVQKAAREIFKNQSVKVTAEQKLQVFEDLCGKSHSESQFQVAAFFELPVVQSAQQKVQADESVRVEFTLSKESFEKIKRAQELLSHSLNTQDLGQFLEYLSEKVIRQKTGLNNQNRTSSTPGNISFVGIETFVNSSNTTTTNISVTEIDDSASLSSADAISTATVAARKTPALKNVKQLKNQQQCCQYIDPGTGRRCESKWLPQVDHKQSRWAGGNHQLENLQILCAGHNRLKYRIENGVKYSS
ncbi:HNH endonuclease [Bdellovibrio sp. KM01]|uniref:HNH endonuclease n=1 Tax=Bdellovibrio sp. KM01 TaxID=2748865 RepID=UPI0015E9FD6E|nr:HNH endonuclease signature motif containing protein [Bdellovibrio sp. KM01]QLY24459.1 HNH endonuclease [Bdellovibrio sp. KM01]